MRFLAAFLILFAVLSQTDPVRAQGRFALLIGNQKYSPKIGQLTNPLNDVALVKNALIQVGFDDKNVEVLPNANASAIHLALKRFQFRLKAAGPDALGFFYYSGHGASSRLDANGKPSNFII